MLTLLLFRFVYESTKCEAAKIHNTLLAARTAHPPFCQTVCARRGSDMRTGGNAL